MSDIKKLAGETVIYGGSSIIARLLNWFLTPLYAYIFVPGEFGVLSNILAYVAFFQVILTFGMETSYFRFASQSKEPGKIFSTAMISLLISSLLFVGLILGFANEIAGLLDYRGHENYIIWMGITLALDTLTTIPFAKLRLQSKPLKFAAYKTINISVNIFLNIFWIYFCPKYLQTHPDSILKFIYSDQIGIGYAFLSYLIASAVTLLLFIPDFKFNKIVFEKSIFYQMIKYGWPILIVGIAGMVNTQIDKILIPELINSDNPTAELGIYSANSKLALLMALFIQAFRFSFEPFLFSHFKYENSKLTYARVMKYFVILGLLIFLVVMFYMDILKYFIGKTGSEYYEGIKVVPWLLLGNLFLGMFYTQSLWYKLTDKTHYGAKFAIIGAVITLTINILFIPTLGYMASGYAFFTASLVMTVSSYYVGQKHFPVKYDLVSIATYFTVAVLLFLASNYSPFEEHIMKLSFNSLLITFFLLFVWVWEYADLYKLFKR